MVKSKLFKVVLGCAVLCVLPSLASAFPGAVNLIPCTDLVGANNLRLGYESDGHAQPYDSPYTQYLYSEYGVNDKLEIGLDSYDTENSTKNYFNAKYLVSGENGKMPAIAVGTMFVNSNNKSSFFAVGCKTFGKTRFHLGAQTQGDKDWLLVGADYAINDKFTLLADYQSGQNLYQTLGLYWKANQSLGVTVYYVRNNTEALRDTDVLCLNLGYTLALQ